MSGTPDNPTVSSSLGRTLLSVALYKRNQGRVTRQVTFFAIMAAWLLGVWRLWQVLPVWTAGSGAAAGTSGTDLGLVRFAIPLAIAAAGVWLAYRLVNLPRFAEFLIGVESEMAKVSWPSLGEVARSSAVVIIMIFALALILGAYDVFWRLVLDAIQGFR